MIGNDEAVKLEQKLEKHICEKSYFEFFKKAVYVLEPETDWAFNWHIEEACNRIEKEVLRIGRKQPKKADLAFNLPPSSSKSMIFSVCLAGWAWIHVPHLRIATNSYNDALAVDHCRKASRLIHSDWYQELWGDLFNLTKDTQHEFENDQGGIRKVGAQTGRHFDIVIGDDLINPEMAESEAERYAANQFWFKTIPSRFRNLSVGLKLLVMQRLHEEDPCGKVLEDNLNYDFMVVPAEYSEDLKPAKFKDYYKEGSFWNERFPLTVLKEMRKVLSERDYASQYLQRPAPAEGILVKRDWLNIVNATEVVFNPESDVMHFFLDTAYTEKHEENDPTALLAAFKRGNDVYIVDAEEQWLNYPDLRNYIPAYINRNGGSNQSVVHIEGKASGLSIVQDLRRHTSLNVKEYKGADKDKRVRLNSVTPQIMGGHLYLIKGTWTEHYISQLISFPYAKHDDMVDTTVMAIEELLQKSFDFMFL